MALHASTNLPCNGTVCASLHWLTGVWHCARACLVCLTQGIVESCPQHEYPAPRDGTHFDGAADMVKARLLLNLLHIMSGEYVTE